MFAGKKLLITGGTGSFGQAFVGRILSRFPNIERIVIYSRDELKQFEMRQVFPHHKFPQLRFFLGDVRDQVRLRRACEGIDTLIHAAALKQVPAAEYNPMECIKTNIMGAYNVIETALDTNVKDIVALSTDKAASPVNLYGATKLCSDKLFVAANNIKGGRTCRFSVVRYGNVLGSRGSVAPLFLKLRELEELPITDPAMTRFNITLEKGVEMVLMTLQSAWGGEIFVPKIPSFKIVDLARAVSPNAKQKVIGIRPGEKLHEEMITQTDALNTVEFSTHYAILPDSEYLPWDKSNYIAETQSQLVDPQFRYSSDCNKEWLSVQQLQNLIKDHVDPNFIPKV